MTPSRTAHIDPAKVEKAARAIVFTLAEAIQGVRQIPNGHLYALVMSRFSFELYTATIEKLKEAKLIRESSHLLTWTGPADWTFDKAMADSEPKVVQLTEVEDGHDWEGFVGGCQRMGCATGCVQPRPVH